MTRLKVLSVASEVFPLVKTGGLADVAGALPGALSRENIQATTLAPGYPALLAKLDSAEPVHRYDSLFGGPARLLAAKAGELNLFILDAPHLFTRDGNIYAGPDGLDWPDNAQRFAALARVAADIGKGAATSFAPDIVHAHDWQAALAPAYLHYDGGRRPGTVITVHNLAFQGHFPASLLAALELPPDSLVIDGVEYFGGIGFLKAGLQFADRITTVSPTYAREIMTPESGMALDGLLRRRASAVEGIVNGIDVDVWNPEDDAHLPQPYSAARIDMRATNKTALQRRMDLEPKANAPLFGVVTRISSQKGLDLLLDALPALVEQGGQLALLGSGDRVLQEAFAQAARDHAGAVGCIFEYDEGIAHLVQAGSDFILVPSRFEPCGLTQLCALRYGAAPIVARVGGLADTVIDANEAALAAGVATGLQFAPPAADQLAYALKRAGTLYQDAGAMRRLRLNGMRADVSWRGPAKRYAALYQEIAAANAGSATDAA
ncbi:glycogen synthase GlgA [Methylocapsa sp. S129]|uniref:glycogen synthase GlgA n=1 Tax=Methylocapsa sp. S129 TaxID=1641869 RepID=UPI00131B3E43|nr:glycogen synthase GlgA [Methylocapsa sp. S129]